MVFHVAKIWPQHFLGAADQNSKELMPIMQSLKQLLLIGPDSKMALISPLVVITFVSFTVIDPIYAGELFANAKNFISVQFGAYYIFLMTFLLLLTIFLCLSPASKIKLGKDNEAPEFTLFQWFSMLFGAGIGIGILFWSIAEPLTHIQGNPFLSESVGITRESAQIAMRLSIFHWGLHGWAIYAMMGMSLAYFSFRQGLPLSIRSTLFSVFGDKIYGPLGFVADLLAVIGTVFGIATSLGLGAQQINAGLNYLVDLDISITIQILMIAVISTIATISALTGVNRGIRILSVLNMRLTLLILLGFFLLGPTTYLLNSIYTNAVDYMINLPSLSIWIDPDRESKWQGWWTIFYWGWWIAWAPFCGMFIARISRGRTIREFIVGVLLAPTILAVVWITIFGNTAIYLELYGNGGVLEAVNLDRTTALFKTIELMGYGNVITSTMAIICVILLVTYFVTSADSATLVICTLVSMGNVNPERRFQIFWGLAIGAVAAALLFAGGLEALQTASIAAALPFSIVVILACISLCRSLFHEGLNTKDNTSNL